MTEPWPLDRREEVEKMRDLIRMIASIDNGSGFIGCLEHCIELADSLQRSRIVHGRVSFVQFISDKATGEQA